MNFTGAGMFFDDRLATVLRQRADSEAGMRTQFRQLLDILGARKYGRDGGHDHSLIAAAWLRMDALARSLPANERAAMIRERGWRFQSADLAAHLADFEPEVASAALNRASLSSEDWSALIPRLPVRARGFLRLRRDLPVDVENLLAQLGVFDRGLPSPDEVAASEGEPFTLPPETAPAPEAPPPQPEPAPPVAQTEPDPTETGRSEISALVERIAQFKRTRDTAAAEAERSPGLPLDLPSEDAVHRKRVGGFGFAADAAGRIEWADAEVASMVMGMRLIAPPTLGEHGKETALERAFARRQPALHTPTQLKGAPAIEGEWIVDAEPRFTDDGNFSGYVGRFRRPVEFDAANGFPAAREADRIRQLLHELRTPVTAVQGYAEVIQQQLFGPAPHEYRALAAAIAADAAHILAGFEELDRLAKLETGASAVEPGEADLASIAIRTAHQLAQALAPRMAGIAWEPASTTPIQVALDEDDAEALVWRLLATLGGGCAAQEVLDASLVMDGDMARLSCSLPQQLAGEADIFTAEAKPVDGAINAGLFGAGFALRLARAEARSAGGSLAREEDRVILSLPLVEAIELGGDDAPEAAPFADG